MANRIQALEVGKDLSSNTRSIQKPSGEGFYVTAVKDKSGKLCSIGIAGDGEEAAWMRIWASTASIAMQYGAPPKDLIMKYIGHRIGDSWFDESGRMDSVLDATCKWLMSQLNEA